MLKVMIAIATNGNVFAFNTEDATEIIELMASLGYSAKQYQIQTGGLQAVEWNGQHIIKPVRFAVDVKCRKRRIGACVATTPKGGANV